MQGNNFQLDKEPLLEITIYKPPEKDAHEIAKLVDIIKYQKRNNKNFSKPEKMIDEIIYKLYEITPDEQRIVEGI